MPTSFNPHSLKFLPGRPVLKSENGTGLFLQKGDREYQKSPLAVRLFKIEGVKSVFLGADFLTIGKDPLDVCLGSLLISGPFEVFSTT